MNLEGKKIEFTRIYQNRLQSDLMEYHFINGMHFGFLEDYLDEKYYAIHLETGTAAAKIGVMEVLTEKKAFEFLTEKIKEIPPAKFNAGIEKMIITIKELGFKYPINNI